MNAFAYLRVSGASQIDGTGFDRQMDACQALATDKGFALTETFREEAVTGTKAAEDRPAFQAMIARLVDSGTRIVLIEGMDRLAREYRVQEQLILYLAAKGLSLYAANTGECITDAVMADPMKKALVQIQGIFAELDKSLIVAKLRKGRQITKSKIGRCEGRKPFGHYPGEAAALALIRSLRASGMFCQDIAARLNADAIATRGGGLWHSGTVSKILGRDRVTQTCALDAQAAA